MPERPSCKWHVHPGGSPGAADGCDGGGDSARGGGPAYAELHCRTNFSLLRGASHPEELAQRAAQLGHAALAVTDRNTLAGVVRAHVAAKRAGLPLVIGAEIVPIDAPPLLLLATDRAAYGRLSRLITVGRRRAIKGDCRIFFDDLAAHADGLIGIHLDADVAGSADADAAAVEALVRHRALFGDRAYAAVELGYGADDAARLARRVALARRAGVPLVAANDVQYHDPARRPLHDLLTCIRRQCTLATAGRRLSPNARRCLHPPAEMARLMAGCPEALARTVEIAARCRFSLDELRYEYPHELAPAGRTAMEYLAELSWAGAAERYGGRVPAPVRQMVEHELALIAALQYEPYFLTVWDVVRFARQRGILCQGRGSAANSAVCYCLGITAVDPVKVDLLFERFVSRERNEPPDIDVDFEHERREEVFQYIYEKYGRERAAITAEVITYRPRSAIRDAGKALGLSADRVDALARRIDWWDREALPAEVVAAAGLRADDGTVRQLQSRVRELVGFPRHLSQHVGGFVMTAGPLCETVPILNGAMPDRTFIEWDKDDLDALGMLKVDCLALGMLTCIRKAFDWLPRRGAAGGPMGLADVPAEDPAVYDMICAADTVGVFQIESRAQMSMLPRLRPRNFYDLVIEVAIVRPGPIQGGMVHPYLRRRAGQEPVRYPSAAVEGVLGKTLGVPLFQEQAMRLAVVAAGFSPGEADRLRRAMAAWKRHGGLEPFRERFLAGMRGNGYAEEFAERCFAQLRGFGEYGFPESHAASFALLVYVSAWLKRYSPAAFAAALLNSQPMGFYAPAQIVRDARAHGVRVSGPDVNAGAWDCTLEPCAGADCCAAAGTAGEGSAASRGPALRLGFRLIKGLSEGKLAGLVAARGGGPFRSVGELARRSGAPRDALARLAAAGALDGLAGDRRAALWQVLGLDDADDLFAALEPDEPAARLPEMALHERVVEDYDRLGLCLVAHPMELVRTELAALGARPNAGLSAARTGGRFTAAGLVLVRQRPSTAKGIVFMTLEDESGVANLIVRPEVWDRDRRAARGSVAVIAEGTVERQGAVVHLLVRRIADISAQLGALRSPSRDFH